MNSKDYICIIKAGHPRYRQIISPCNFFTPNERITVRIKEDKIIFSKATFDYEGKTYNPQKTTSKWITFHITAELPYGKFVFDPDESDIDQKTAYLK